MLSKTEILDTFKPGDLCQVVAEEVPGIPGRIHEINDDSIVIGPYEDEALIETYGDPTSAVTMIPLDTITLLFKLDPSKANTNNKDSK